MAHTEQELQDFMDSISDDPDTRFKMLLYVGDLDEAFESDEDWGELCEFAMKIEEERNESMPFMLRYKEAMEKGGFDAMRDAIHSDMHDNYIFAAMGLHQYGIAKNMRFIPAAAYNKHCFVGFHGEFALVRFLHWSGFNINAVEEDTGMSALHYFASIKYPPNGHMRAVEWLLEHGADPNVQNARGDTPLTYMSGNIQWSDELTSCFGSIVKAGGNPFMQSEDGSTPLSLLKQNNEAAPHESRAVLISTLEAIYAELLAEQAGGADDGDGEQDDDEESAAAADAEPVAELHVATEPEPAKPVQSAQVEQPSQKSEPQSQRTVPAKAVAAMAPNDLDALMKLQGVAWGNGGKPVKVSLGDK